MQAPRTRASELPTLTPLRGLAALLVVLYHFTELLLPALDLGNTTAFLRKGYLAVDLFFLISGCVIAHVYGNWFRRGLAASDFALFVRARLARIYPLHLAVLALFLVFLGVRQIGLLIGSDAGSPPWPSGYPFAALGWNLLLVHGLWHGPLTWNFPSWSVSAEVFAYLVFPVAAPIMWRLRAVASMAFIAGLFAALVWLAQRHGGWEVVNVPPVLRCLIQFLIGVLLYRLHEMGIFAGLLGRDATFVGAAGLVLLLLHLGLADLLVIAAFALLVLAGIRNGGRAAALLHARPLTWLGEISYSVYMTQALVLWLATGGLHYVFGPSASDAMSFWESLIALLVLLGVLLLISHLTYRRIERPARQWLKGGAARPGSLELSSSPHRPAL